MKQGSITSFMKKKGTESDVSNINLGILNSSKSAKQTANLSQNDHTKEIVSSVDSQRSSTKIQDNLDINESRKKRRHIIDEDEEEVVNMESFAEDLLITGKESKIDKGIIIYKM